MRRLSIILVAAVITGAMPAAVFASSKDVADAVDAAVVKWMGDNAIGHAELAVSAHGKVIKSYKHDWPPTEDHPIGSLSKAITGLCVAGLIDNGKLKTTDTVGTVLATYFKDKSHKPADDRFTTITIDQLLTHSSGLKRDFAKNKNTLEGSFASAVGDMLDAPPGLHISYSNTGYMVLGYIVQTLAKSDYQTYCGGVFGKWTQGAKSGALEKDLIWRGPNGGWEESAENYAKFLLFLDPYSKGLGGKSRAWFDSVRLNADYVDAGNAPCAEFKHDPGYGATIEPAKHGTKYGFGVCAQTTSSGWRYYHTGKAAGALGGGSLFLVNAGGFAAVVIFDKAAGYDSLFTAVDKALSVPDAFALSPYPDGTLGAKSYGSGGGSAVDGKSECNNGQGTYKNKVAKNMTGDVAPTATPASKPCH